MRVRRTEWIDWYVDGDESAVFVDGNVVVLSTLASVLVEAVGVEAVGVGAVGVGADLDDLTRALVEQFGEPDGGDAGAATERIVGELVDSAVLAWVDR